MFGDNQILDPTHPKLTRNPRFRASGEGRLQRLLVDTQSPAQDPDQTGYVVCMGKKNASSTSKNRSGDKVELPALLTKEQVADYFGVSPRTVEAWRSTKTGPVPIKIGKHLRWTADAIRAYVESQHVA